MKIGGQNNFHIRETFDRTQAPGESRRRSPRALFGRKRSGQNLPEETRRPRFRSDLGRPQASAPGDSTSRRRRRLDGSDDSSGRALHAGWAGWSHARVDVRPHWLQEPERLLRSRHN